jgi:hypothetical protein
MTIKIQCGCGAKYAFDATPAHMRSGVRLVCESCGTDNSEAVTQILRQQLAHVGILETAPRPVLEAIPLGVVSPVEEVPAETVASPAIQPAQTCLKHPGYTYAGQCLMCQKPLCEKCLELSGYVCSPLCKAKAESMRLVIPEYAGQRVAVERKYWGRVKLAAWSIGAVVVLLLGAWGWYSFVGSHPRVAWSIKLPPSDYGGYCKLVTPTQLLVWHGDRLARYDIEQRREVWATPLLDKEQLAVQATNWLARHGEYADLMLGKRDLSDPSAKREKVEVSEVVEGLRAGFANEIKVRLIGESVWVLFPDRLAQFDWASGKTGPTVVINDRLNRFETSNEALFIVTTDDLGRENLMRVDARTGTVTEERIPVIPAPKATKPVFRGGETDVFLQPFRTELVNAKRNFVLMGVTLVETKVAQHRAMEQHTGKSVLDGDINAANSAAVANEIINEWQRERTGGMRSEDESRYAITLKRLLGDAAADWTGEVIGPPAFYALDNVDIVAAGKTIQVFDKANKRLWQSSLGFSMAQQSAYNRDPYAEDFEVIPAVERSDRLYFFDPGVLTCFELATGKVIWRLQAVGVSKVQFDEEGTLYVTATSAGVDTLRHSQQVDVTRTIHPLILKVAPSNGKILWDVPRRAQACRFTGKFIYAIEASKGEPAMLTRPAVPEHMRVYRLESDTGRILWEHYDKRMPLSWDCADKTIPILFRDELQVLSFLSF